MPDVTKGLEGVVVAQTRLSKIDGDQGKLIYRGYDIHDLAQHASFEETTYLLWHGKLPTRKELEAFSRELGARRALSKSIEDLVTGPLASQSAMAALRTAVSALSIEAGDARPTAEDALAHGRDILAKTPTIVAAHARARARLKPVRPNEDLDLPGAFLAGLTGKAPHEEPRRAMDIALVLHADHGFNASTFAARVTASTLADVHCAVTSAIGALSGSLHGGANTNVMRMLEEIGSVERAVPHVKAMLERHERVPGFGHRVYKVLDPRAVHLKRMSKTLGEHTGDAKWYEMTAAIEDFMARDKKLYPNVDLYSASTYHALGIATDLYTPIFAIARMAGWLAHVAEQYRDNRLIRPRSDYVGERDLKWVPMESR